MELQYKGWKNYSCFFSAEYCQAYLKKSYQRAQIDNYEQKSYENCYAFLYYLEHGKTYYEQAEKAPLIIKPILLFYGLVHLIKSCILTVDPAYPETTSVLAHGVSTRKRKKQNYLFFHDEVKLQKNGLFPFMSEKMFHMKQLEGEKVFMEELLQHVPELDDLFFVLEGKRTFVRVDGSVGSENLLTFPDSILDHFHMTEDRFKEFLKGKFGDCVEFGSDGLGFSLKQGALAGPCPLRYNLEDESLGMPVHKGDLFSYPELLIHYLLLYNLSMIARYETEWWSELTKMMPNHDYPFIESFLNVTLEKGPFLVYQYLMR